LKFDERSVGKPEICKLLSAHRHDLIVDLHSTSNIHPTQPSLEVKVLCCYCLLKSHTT
jgi:hypothetical protein